MSDKDIPDSDHIQGNIDYLRAHIAGLEVQRSELVAAGKNPDDSGTLLETALVIQAFRRDLEHWKNEQRHKANESEGTNG